MALCAPPHGSTRGGKAYVLEWLILQHCRSNRRGDDDNDLQEATAPPVQSRSAGKEREGAWGGGWGEGTTSLFSPGAAT